MKTTRIVREFETPQVEPQRIAIPIEQPAEEPIPVYIPEHEPEYVPLTAPEKTRKIGQ
jgi:hypothetical protein